MNSATLNPFLSAFGWTLLHFLWEAALLGLLAWILLWMTRKSNPETRYVIACGALGLMVLAFMVTLVLQMRSGPDAPMSAWISMNVDGATSWVIRNDTNPRQSLEALLPEILFAWTLGACIMTARLATGLLWLHGSCLPKAKPADEAWQSRFHALAVSMGLPCTPRFLSSEKVDSPLVLGWFRPVVLVPAAAFLSLDAGMLETLLVHELAHVRRWDYLANLLQNMAEALFFFHPAVWWVSRQIRREREHCCDDAAVRRCGDPIIYASALAALEALRVPTTHSIRLAPAAKGGSLMLRIRRILVPEDTVTSGPPAFSLASALVLALAIGFINRPVQAQPPPPPPPPPAEDEDVPPPPPLPPPPSEMYAPHVKGVPFSKVRVKFQPPPPAYPEDARVKRIQGTVVVVIVVDKDGRPKFARAVSGPEELRMTAVGYAMEWRFEPVKVKGNVVEARFKLTMPFRLH